MLTNLMQYLYMGILIAQVAYWRWKFNDILRNESQPYKLVTSFCFSFYFLHSFQSLLRLYIRMYSILDSFKIFHQRLSKKVVYTWIWIDLSECTRPLKKKAFSDFFLHFTKLHIYIYYWSGRFEWSLFRNLSWFYIA